MRQAALVVGCGDFVNSSIPKLHFAARDAERFRDTLVAMCGLDNSDIATLTSLTEDSISNASRSNILRITKQIKEKLFDNPIDRFYLFISGHGFISPESGELHLVCSDSVNEVLEETSVSVDKILSTIKISRPSQVLVFLDMCRSNLDGAKSLTATSAKELRDRLIAFGSVTVFSCQPEERSYEAEQVRAGIFTEALLEALSETGSCSLVGELCDYVTRRVPELSNKYDKPPQYPVVVLEAPEFSGAVIVSDVIWARRSEERLIANEIRPGEIRKKSIEPREVFVGIDFGTSKSACAYYDSDLGDIAYIETVDGGPLVRSAVFTHDNLRYHLGATAYDYYKTAPDRYVESFKRHFGSAWTFDIDGISLSPGALVSMVLRSIRLSIEDQLDCTSVSAVVSMPVQFSLRQVSELNSAFLSAGFKVLRSISEASAAAVPVSLLMDQKKQQAILIVDMGGGTFDTAVAEVGDGIVEMVVLHGDRNLGGRDVDDAILAWINEEIKEENRLRDAVRRVPQCLTYERQVEVAKMQLNAGLTAYFETPDLMTPDGNVESMRITIDSERYEKIVAPLAERVERVLDDTLLRYETLGPGSRYRRISHVMLAGQGCRLNFVREAIAKRFPEAAILDQHMENAVVRGLGYQAGVMAGSVKSLLLLDVFHWRLGVMVREKMGELDGPNRKVSVFDVGIASQNTDFLLLLDEDVTIPTKKTAGCVQFGIDVKVGELLIAEDGDRDHRVVWGAVSVDISQSRRWYLTTDVDANFGVILALEAVDGPSQRYELPLSFSVGKMKVATDLGRQNVRFVPVME